MSNQARKQEPAFSAPVSVSEISHFAENIDTFSEAAEWVRTYLARPHPALGRTGPVCPFAKPALIKDTIRVAVVRLAHGDKRAQIIRAIQHHLDSFVSTAGPDNDRLLHSTLILFPDVSLEEAPNLIDLTKEELKTKFIEQGLMLGEFHALNESPGLHNPEFRPLRSPIPMLAIRYMVPTDFVFLDRAEYDVSTRIQYLQAYLAVPHIPQASREEAERAVASLRAH
jgi:hypothetical protein